MYKSATTILLLLVSPSAFAVQADLCGIKTHIPNHATGNPPTIECENCRTFDDFGYTGGAFLSQLSSRTVRLSNSSGVSALVSIERQIPSGHTFGFPLGPFGSWNYPLPDPYHSAITVDAISGYIHGQRWDSRKTPDTSLDAKCKQIEKEQEAKEKAQKERQRAIVSEGKYDTSSYWQNGNPHFLFKPPKRKVWVPITGDESCGTEPCPWWDDEEYSDAYKRIDTIPYWYRKLLERRNERREPRITTEEIRSSGGGRGGFGFGGFAVAPGGVAESQHGTEKEK